MPTREKISILVATKERPLMFDMMRSSAIENAYFPDDLEIVASVNGRDEGYRESYPNTKIIYNDDNRVLSSRMNDAYLNATGNIFVGSDDDVMFRTVGWDLKVREAFEYYPDKIVLVYGSDLNPYPTTNIAFPIIHRAWPTVIGRLFTPYFSSDFSDTWLCEIATNLHRIHKIDIIMEHMHHSFGKREKDKTDTERWDAHFSEDMPKKYRDTLFERIEEGEQLREYIKNYAHTISIT